MQISAPSPIATKIIIIIIIIIVFICSKTIKSNDKITAGWKNNQAKMLMTYKAV